MKQLIETFVTIFLVVLAVLLFSQFIGVELKINGAKDFHAEAISQIEASNFKPEVIDVCKKQAQEYGYRLEVQNIKTDKLICNSCNTIFVGESGKCPNCNSLEKVNYAKERICKVKLHYSIDLEFINVHQMGVIGGYAR